RPDDPLPRVLLRDQEDVIAEAPDPDREVETGRDLGLARGDRDDAPVEVLDLRLAVALEPADPVRHDEDDPEAVGGLLQEQAETYVATGHGQGAVREAVRRVGQGDRPVPERLAGGIADQE